MVTRGCRTLGEAITKLYYKGKREVGTCCGWANGRTTYTMPPKTGGSLYVVTFNGYGDCDGNGGGSASTIFERVHQISKLLKLTKNWINKFQYEKKTKKTILISWSGKNCKSENNRIGTGCTNDEVSSDIT